MKPRIVVIAGPTACGKTALALELARRIDGELVGADSVQVYRGFDIGSAKPTVEELAGIAHHMIDVIAPDEAIDAAEYAARADEAIASIAARGRVPIVVGGTGLWIRALLRGLVDVPKVDPVIRAALEAEIEALGSRTLHARLAEVDPHGARAIHPHDALRIVRALEVHTQTGKAMGELRREHALGAHRYEGFFVALDATLDVLEVKIAERLESMIASGMLDEIRSLLERYDPAVRAFGSVGYKQLVPHVQGLVSLAAAKREAYLSTRTYARKQRNWFRGEPGFERRMSPADVLEASTFEALVRAVRP
jgi:tRNA dimethylallyltransferase